MGGEVVNTCKDFQTLLSETERMKTFINWPHTFISPQDLAQAGFYFLRQEDKVMCVFCKGCLGDFVPGDTAWGEHMRHLPNYSFVKLMECQLDICMLCYKSERIAYAASLKNGSTNRSGPQLGRCHVASS